MRYIALISAFSCVLVLPACSYFSTDESVDVTNSAEVIDLMGGSVEGAAEDVVEAKPLPAPISTSEVFAVDTKGSVEIYDLNAPPIRPVVLTAEEAAAERSVALQPAAGQGRISNPSVEIYPLD